MRYSTYPFGRAFDMDGGGGAADLQTDVMRFMAILSLCLVAIFALVQSIPTQVPAPPQAEAEPKPPEPAPAVPVSKEPVVVEATAPVVFREPVEPAPAPEPEAPPVVATPRPAAPPPKVEQPPSPPEPAPPEPQEGFTLRFASDQALTALVAREDIGFYAIGPEGASRMQFDRGRVEFWQASLPKQYHEMHASTVPGSVRDALRRSGQPADVVWAVTLPSRLSRDLDRFLANYTGGDLIIAANGTMRREE